jgi:hypothetical protein
MSLMGGIEKLLGDKAYDGDPFRRSLRRHGITQGIESQETHPARR